MKICPVCKQQFQSKAALASHMLSAHPARRARATQRSRQQNMSGGTNMLARRELWSGTMAASTVIACEIFPGNSKLPMLDAMAQIYEEFKVVSWSVSVKSTVGTNSDGSYTCGITYGNEGRPTKAEQIASLAPATSNPVYVPTTISVNPRKVMGANWLPTKSVQSTKSPGAFMITSDKNVQLWISYKVLFNGPTAVKRASFDELYEFDTVQRKWLNADGNEVRQVNFEDPVTVQIDVGTNNENMFVTTINAISGVIGRATQVHRLWNRVFGAAHYIGTNLIATLPQLTVPVIMHVQRRPFPALMRRFIELGYSAPQEDDPGIDFSNCETPSSEFALDDGPE